MKTRFFAIGLAVMSAALVACGGGGGGNNNNYTPPTPTPTATATPTPAPTDNPNGCVGQTPFTASARRISSVPHPLATGDSFTYTGSLTKTYVQSAPCVQPTSTTAAQITIGVKNAAATSPAGATDVQSTETDAFPTQTTTTTTDQIVQLTGTAYQMLSTTSSDANGNSIATAYGNPQTLDNVPEKTGTWSNNPAATVTETLSDGSSVLRTIASDGSYTDSQTFGGGGFATIAVNGAENSQPLDGSGAYTFAGTEFSYAAPSGGTITLSILQNNQLQKTRTFPAWFTPPTGGSYITDSFTDNGQQTIPSSCNTSLAAAGEQIVETNAVLDPVLGYTDKRITTSYVVSGYGAACVTISDALDSYYDYSDDTTRIDYQSENGQPNSVDTIAETIGMQSANCAGGGTGPCTALRRSQSDRGVSPVTVAIHVAAIAHRRAVERLQRLQSLHAFVLHLTNHGGAQK